MIDFSTDYTNTENIISSSKTGYFGEFQRNIFTVFYKEKGYLKNQTWLQINGEVINDELTLIIRLYAFWTQIISAIIVAFFSIILMIEYSLYFGAFILLIDFVQLYFTYKIYFKKRNQFIENIERIINE